MKDWNEIKKSVQQVATKAYNEGLVAGTSGNVSYYDRESNRVFITPTNGDYSTMKPEDIVVITLDGEVVEGQYKPSSEWLLHVELYKNYEHVNSVIHTHSPYATGFAIVDEKIPLILVEMLPFLGGDVPVAKFGMPGTSEVGLNAADVMVNRNAALLQNHGVVAVGKNPEQAYIRAIYVEDAAKAYHYAKLMGEPRLVSEEAQDVLRKRYNLKK
ncbi:MAG: class II aldolase/adducin family protein [Clostridium sp.]